MRQLLVFLLCIAFLSCSKDTKLSKHLPIALDKDSSSGLDSEGESSFLRHFLKPNDTVFDIGAHVGSWSKKALLIEPNIHIVAFEPIPEIFARLKKNMGRKGMSVYNLAISDRSGRSDFFFYNQDWQVSKLSSFYKRSLEWNRKHVEPVTIQVEHESLDQFCHLSNIEKIDLLNIATEGSEMRILHGAENMLRRGKIRAIEFEYDTSFRSSGCTLKEVVKYLTHHDYVLFQITKKGLVHIQEWEMNLEKQNHTNYFAIKNEEVPEFSKIGNLDTLQTSIWK